MNWYWRHCVRDRAESPQRGTSEDLQWIARPLHFLRWGLCVGQNAKGHAQIISI